MLFLKIAKMRFVDKLLQASRKNDSLLCVGLDTDIEYVPSFLADKFGTEAIYEFNKQIIEATKDLVCAYKPNIAFYEMLGPKGFNILKKTREYIPANIPVIIDAKRADIGNTATAYAKAFLSAAGPFQFDGITVNPYLGYDSLEPFLQYKDKGIFLLCRTSNPGAKDFQDLKCNGKPLYQIVAHKAVEWNVNGNLGVVAGATFPKELVIIRKIIGAEMPMLIPGVGTQTGDLQKAVEGGINSKGELALISASRSIIFASSGEDFAEAARAAALTLKEEINRYRLIAGFGTRSSEKS